MSHFVAEIPANFDWDSNEGRLMNLFLNMAGGLEYDDLTEEEKQLLSDNGYKREDDGRS